MSQHQKNPGRAADQGQTCEETKGLQIAAVSSDVEEPCTSSHFMASSLKGQTCKETQGLQVAAVSSDMEETCSSSHLRAISLKSQTCKETQGLEKTQVSRDVEEPCSSSRSLMASYQNDPADDTPSTSGGLQSPYASSSESGEGSSSCSLMASYQNDPADDTPSTSGGLQSPYASSSESGESSSSRSLMASYQNDPADDTPSTSGGLQSPYASSSESGEGSSSRSLMASYQNDPADDTPSTSGGLQSPYASSSESGEGSSSRSLMASYQNDPADDTPSTSGGLQSPYASSSESGEGLSNQAVQGYPFYPPFQQDTVNVSVDSKVNFLVNYMLYKYQMKEIMSMTEILSLIVKEDGYRFHEILMRAAERMEMVFGLDVKEVDPVNHCYALFIKLGLTYDGMRSDEYSFPKTGLLIVILGVVFMKGNRATEDEIWEVLNPMGIYAGMNHFVFGDPRKLITNEFVKEQYLVYQPVANSDPVQYEYVWGPRARVETSKMKVLEFVAKIHRTDPTAFQSQYEEALIEEEERTLAMILNSAGPRPSSGESSSAMGSSFPHIYYNQR